MLEPVLALMLVLESAGNVRAVEHEKRVPALGAAVAGVLLLVQWRQQSQTDEGPRNC